jgi:hypothetical protein
MAWNADFGGDTVVGRLSSRSTALTLLRYEGCGPTRPDEMEAMQDAPTLTKTGCSGHIIFPPRQLRRSLAGMDAPNANHAQ